MRRKLVLLVVLGLCAALSVSAQDSALDFGITATVTPSVLPQSFDSMDYDVWWGGIVHITSSFVLRPSFLFAQTKEELYGDTVDRFEGDTTAWGISGSLCYYLRPLDELYVFFGLGGLYYEYGWFFGSATDDRAYNKNEQLWGPYVIVGAQAMITKRFGFITDIGMEYVFSRDNEIEYDAGGSTVVDSTEYKEKFSFRSAYLGAVFYIRSK